MSKVNHPSHYNWIKGIECEDVIRHFDYPKGAAIKHIWRCGKKNSETEFDDLSKAIHYLTTAMKTVIENNEPSVRMDDLIAARQYMDEVIDVAVKLKNKGTN